jgi:uncharacterized protein (TIGR00369 family)
MAAATEAVPALTIPLAKLRFDHLIPFHRSVGLRLRCLDPRTGTVTLHLPLHRRNYNAANTVHGGVILALAESVHGLAISVGLQQQHQGIRIFTKVAQLRYLKKGTSDLFATCTLAPETIAGVAAKLHAKGVTEVALTSTVTDTSGASIAELAATYHVSCRRRTTARSDPR